MNELSTAFKAHHMKPTTVHVPKKAGIWIDKEKAYIFLMIGNSEPVMHKVKSNVEFMVRFPGEKQEVSRFHNSIIGDRESKQHRQNQELHHFYKEVISHLADTDYIYVFGPGQARHGLLNLLQEEKTLKASILPSERAGRMTLNQMKAKVIDHFTPEQLKRTERQVFHA